MPRGGSSLDSGGMSTRAALAAAVQRGDVTPRALVEASLARIEQHDGALNAVVALRADDALTEAEAHPRTGPFAGLPLLVKDLARTGGLRTTFGSPWYAGAPTDTVDDVIVARYKRAGAIVIGKSNTPAFGHTAVTTNKVFGPTRNPWNTDRSPGGSSGGSAAALAAGLVPLATSSDGGGSVRIPAALCGLVGYKATNGAIGRPVLPRWLEFSSFGVTAATVADAILEADVVLGPAPGDLMALPRAAVDLTLTMPRRVIACPTLRGAIDDDIAAAFDEACRTIESELRLPVQRVDAVTSVGCSRAWFVMAAAELAQSLAADRHRWDDLEPSLRLMVDIGVSVSLDDYLAAARQRWAECLRVDELLDEDAVVVTPTTNAVGWAPEGPLPTTVGGADTSWGALNTPDFNFTGHPAVSVPMGHDSAGVPIGLQIVAPRCRDGLALGFAQAWERVRPWPLVAPGFTPYDVDSL
jgi:Asp-tRNA(Asn)/Glu-tRNA(Gln) amidotransferase A subunit family amidase